MTRALFLLLLLCTTRPAHAAETAGAVDRPGASAWLADFEEALRRHDNARLAAMIDAGTTVTVQLVDHNEAPLQLTLTREEYLQQLRALWRFATGTRYLSSNVSWIPEDDGRITLALDQDEYWTLFGTDTGQQNRLRIRLALRNGQVRAVDIRTTTHPR